MNKKRILFMLTGLIVVTAVIALFLAPWFKSADPSRSVFINQWGFLPHQNKIAVLFADSTKPFTVTELKTNQPVMKSKTTPTETWALAGQPVSRADITGVTEPGEYRLNIKGAEPVFFSISTNPYGALHDAAIKAFYYARAGLALDPAFAGKWHRSAGHADTSVQRINSTSGNTTAHRKGWYDAGDYNKYMVNSGITTYTLMRAYLDHPDFYTNRYWNIPESMNERPDILDEIMWNLDWMVSMQDTDGGVYHKLTTLNFAGPVMPDAAVAQRYTTAKSTAATLNFAAVMAVAARLFEEQSEMYLERASRALAWAQDNPQQYYRNEERVSTGEYGDTALTDEHNWANIEYAISSQNQAMLVRSIKQLADVSVPSWASTTGLSYLSLLRDARALLPASAYEKLKRAFSGHADQLVTIQQNNAFRIPAITDDFVWGSNAVMMNKAMLLEVAWSLDNQRAYRDASLALVDYISGRNPTGYSFVTGFGKQSPRFIHHRPSEADGIADPVPGWLAGGPQNGHQDNCQYPSDLPALSYLDAWCSYSTNEVAINWNAPLVYVLGSIVADPL